MRLVHNTTLSPVVVSRDGRRVLGCTTATIDITEPRAQKYLSSGVLILVSQTATEEPEPAAPQSPAPRASSKTK